MIELIILVLGFFIGSFLGVLVDRIPKKQNIVKGRSHCDRCKKELDVLDLIPILSFIFLKGKCRYCHTSLSYFYPVIEILTGILFVLTYIFLISNFSSQGGSIFGGQFFPTSFTRAGSSMETTIGTIFNFQFIYYLFMLSSFTVIFFTDLKYGIIPDKIVFSAVLVTFFWLIINRQSFIINHLLSAIGAFLFFVTVSYVFFLLTKKQSMGGGDIKLSFLLGLFLGFPGILVSLYLAFLTGGVLSIILVLWKKKAFLKDTLPFGPFLIAGTIVSLFWGNYLYFLALNLLGV